MEHAIEQAAAAVVPAMEGHGMEQCSESGPGIHRRWIQCSCDEAVEYADVQAWETHRAQVAARDLAEAGLLAPAPLREEWSARYVNGGGAVCRTRDEAEAELDRMICDLHRPRIDEPPAPEIAGIYARYVSEWEEA